MDACATGFAANDFSKRKNHPENNDSFSQQKSRVSVCGTRETFLDLVESSTVGVAKKHDEAKSSKHQVVHLVSVYVLSGKSDACICGVEKRLDSDRMGFNLKIKACDLCSRTSPSETKFAPDVVRYVVK